MPGCGMCGGMCGRDRSSRLMPRSPCCPWSCPGNAARRHSVRGHSVGVLLAWRLSVGVLLAWRLSVGRLSAWQLSAWQLSSSRTRSAHGRATGLPGVRHEGDGAIALHAGARSRRKQSGQNPYQGGANLTAVQGDSTLRSGPDGRPVPRVPCCPYRARRCSAEGGGGRGPDRPRGAGRPVGRGADRKDVRRPRAAHRRPADTPLIRLTGSVGMAGVVVRHPHGRERRQLKRERAQ